MINIGIKWERFEPNIGVLQVPGDPLTDETLEVSHRVAQLPLLLPADSPPSLRQHFPQKTVGDQSTGLTVIGSFVTEISDILLIVIVEGENKLGHVLG